MMTSETQAKHRMTRQVNFLKMETRFIRWSNEINQTFVDIVRASGGKQYISSAFNSGYR